MSKRGYNVIENRQATGRLAGLSIQSRQDGKTWKASELRKGGARDIMTQLDRPTSSIKHRNHHSGQVMAGAMGKTAVRQVGKALSAIGGPLGGGIAGKIITAMAKTPKKTREQER